MNTEPTGQVSAARLPPEHPAGIKRVQVGCGPHNLMEEWWNVDIRQFSGVDEVMDVTQPWRWENLLDFVYGEHFLEHLSIEGALRFLRHAGQALRVGGALRLTTPSLEWVLSSHFTLGDGPTSEQRLAQTFAVNRAFHGWGHQFLYSRILLEQLLQAAGYSNVQFYQYGQSDSPELTELERHGGGGMAGNYPRVWIVEGEKLREQLPFDTKWEQLVEEHFGKYVRSGH